MKSKCPETCLVTYGSCCCRRLRRQIPWLDFKVNWTLLGLSHYTGLKTAIRMIESYTPGWKFIIQRSDAQKEVHWFGVLACSFLKYVE